MWVSHLHKALLEFTVVYHSIQIMYKQNLVLLCTIQSKVRKFLGKLCQAYFLEADNGSDDDQQNIENKDENGDTIHEKRSTTFHVLLPFKYIELAAWDWLLSGVIGEPFCVWLWSLKIMIVCAFSHFYLYFYMAKDHFFKQNEKLCLVLSSHFQWCLAYI